MSKNRSMELTYDYALACMSLRGFGAGAIDYDFLAYADNVTRLILDAPKHYWKSCLDSIPRDLVPLYLGYLRGEIEACDFKRCPADDLFPDNSDAEVERIKLEMQPKYVALVAYVRGKSANRK